MTPTQSRARKLELVLIAYDRQDLLIRTLMAILADARHWCDRNGEDFGKLDRLAYLQYLRLLRQGVSASDDRGGAV